MLWSGFSRYRVFAKVESKYMQTYQVIETISTLPSFLLIIEDVSSFCYSCGFVVDQFIIFRSWPPSGTNRRVVLRVFSNADYYVSRYLITKHFTAKINFEYHINLELKHFQRTIGAFGAVSHIGNAYFLCCFENLVVEILVN